MALNDYDPTTSLDAYFPDRTERRTARLWSVEKLVQDMAEAGFVSLFIGGGANPTVLPNYASSKVWLRVDDGVTAAPGTIRAYDGTGDPAQLASWPTLTEAAAYRNLRSAAGANKVVLAASFGDDANVVLVGSTAVLQVPFDATIASYTLLASTPGSIILDVQKDSYANYPPTSADTICGPGGSARPTLASSNKTTNSTLTGWTRTVVAGDVLRITVVNCSAITRAVLQLVLTT